MALSPITAFSWSLPFAQARVILCPEQIDPIAVIMYLELYLTKNALYTFIIFL